jgi:hypothetical protein
VSVFSVEGDFIRHVGVGVLKYPHGAACSAFDELVVADSGHHRLVMFSASGDVVKTMDAGLVLGVAMHAVAARCSSDDGTVQQHVLCDRQ